MENFTTVKFFNLCGLQETWMNKSVYFPLTLVCYLVIITVNLILIITIITEKGLHEPMYIFICNLSLNSLYGTVGFYPVFLYQLLSNVQVISYGGCLTQGYIVHTFTSCEVTILSVMAFDRYVAICRPLEYHTIMSPLAVGRLLLFAWLYPLLIALILLSLTLRLPLCGSNIYKVFCDNTSILKHSCVSITLSRIWSNIAIVMYVLLILLIAYSYFHIAMVCLHSAEGRRKFTQTCVPHLFTIAVFVLTALFDVLYGWYESSSVSLYARNVMAVQFLVIPPTLNPLIYGLNSKQIRRAFFYKKQNKMFWKLSN